MKSEKEMRHVKGEKWQSSVSRPSRTSGKSCRADRREVLAKLKSGSAASPTVKDVYKTIASDKNKKKRVVRKKKRRRRKRSASHATNAAARVYPSIPLSPELANIVGANALSRQDVIKRLWEYVRANHLMDRTLKRCIACDDALKRLFGGKETVHMFEVTTLLVPHFLYSRVENQIGDAQREEGCPRNADNADQDEPSSSSSSSFFQQDEDEEHTASPSNESNSGSSSANDDYVEQPDIPLRKVVQNERCTPNGNRLKRPCQSNSSALSDGLLHGSEEENDAHKVVSRRRANRRLVEAADAARATASNQRSSTSYSEAASRSRANIERRPNDSGSSHHDCYATSAATRDSNAPAIKSIKRERSASASNDRQAITSSTNPIQTSFLEEPKEGDHLGHLDALIDGIDLFHDVFNPPRDSMKVEATDMKAELTGDTSLIDEHLPLVFPNDAHLELFFGDIEKESLNISFAALISRNVAIAVKNDKLHFRFAFSEFIDSKKNNSKCKREPSDTHSTILNGQRETERTESSSIRYKYPNISLKNNTLNSGYFLLRGSCKIEELKAEKPYEFLLQGIKGNLSTSSQIYNMGKTMLMARNCISDWTVENVCTYVRSLHIPGFARTCSEYAIDGKTLITLTQDDIYGLELTAPFLVKRLLGGIRRLLSSTE